MRGRSLWDGRVSHLTTLQDMDMVIANLHLLNRNLEGVVSLGRDFGKIAELWSGFRRTVVGQEGMPEPYDSERAGSTTQGEKQNEQQGDSSVLPRQSSTTGDRPAF